ncbi:hypothetical protein ACFV6E_21415 [Streptomyces sp. NPDC059785]|uniref:hypothetical protein n=1 Tax=Streptomyces sp. NPDC059785 TaxID=3346945 RepID=UPI0036582673
MDATRAPFGRPAAYLVRAAIAAPSPGNSQPWLFVSRDTALDLYADPARRPRLTDPDGRELVISCGAALFNARLAMRHLGFTPLVRAFPSPSVPTHLARVTWGPYARPDPDDELMLRAIHSRHTHRGPFLPSELPRQLVDALRGQTEAEGAELRTVEFCHERRRLAGLVRAAEAARPADSLTRTGPGAWTPALPDGVPPGDRVRRADRTSPPLTVPGRPVTGAPEGRTARSAPRSAPVPAVSPALHWKSSADVVPGGAP